MMYKVLEVKDLINKKDNDQQILNLMENNGTYLKLEFLKKGMETEAQTAHNDVFLYLIDGEIDVIFSNDENCTCTVCGCSNYYESDRVTKSYKIKKENLFMFPRNVTYSIKSLKDSVILAEKI